MWDSDHSKSQWRNSTDECPAAPPNAAVQWSPSHYQQLFLPGGIDTGANRMPSPAARSTQTPLPALTVVATMRRWLHGAADARSLGVCEADPCVACAWATAGRRRSRLRRAARRFPRSVGDHFTCAQTFTLVTNRLYPPDRTMQQVQLELRGGGKLGASHHLHQPACSPTFASPSVASPRAACAHAHHGLRVREAQTSTPLPVEAS